MRLAARLMITGVALVTGAMATGCSAEPGLAYARGVTKPSASAVLPSPTALSSPTALPSPTAAVATVPPSQLPKTGPAPSILTVGAPRGVKAKAGILVDVTTGQVLWAKDPNTPRPIASITKVMTALLIIEAGNLNRKIVVPRAVTAYVAKNDANAAGLVPGQVLTVDELLHAMLIMSACDAAYTLANAYGPGLPAFIAQMNAEAAKLGLVHTYFTSPDGLPYPTETSTYSTPAELITLGELAMSYPEFRSIVGLRFYALKKGDGHGAYWFGTSNELLGAYPGVIGIKTGFTDAAGHTLLFEAIRNGRTLMGVVLGSPPTGPASGAQAAAKVLNWGFALKQTS
jgi:D-alanyl-D-alanine carboxypeptidase (penicillin-binding protein 5/6)